MSDTFDVAVVGGGPAGCSAAITAAKSGLRVVLFEAKTYPHDKVCGEFLSPECACLLDQLDLHVHLLNPVCIETVLITAPDGAAWTTCFPGAAWGLSRRTLDAALAERARSAGVEMREGTTVADIHGRLTAGFQIETRTQSAQVRARAVIVAHGKRSLLDRSLRRDFLNRPQPFIGLKAHFHGPPLPARIELHTFPGGYCGMSEIEDGSANVCLLVHEHIFQRASQQDSANVEAFLRWMQSQNPRLGHWLAQAEMSSPRWLSIAQVPFVPKDVIVDDILMAGDAAGLIVPLAGDGIAMALHSGILAASHIARFLTKESTAYMLRQQYPAVWRREFAARLRLGRALQTIMLRPRLLSLGLRLMTSVPPLGDYLVRHTRDVSTRRLI